ncbi:MAG: DUF3108 domain-containing protein [Gemmatimonadetes bacterium]|nr:DUF3108 domain-containing protein [Gemmatimonadota bacterium]MBI3567891.1 DUF3108 domain-containing protein [Gemmatimonadota bacterium]
MRARARCRAALAGAFALVAASTAGAQHPASVPWATGERLTYSVRFNGLSVGDAEMRVVGQDTVRGRRTWKLEFGITGGIPFFHVNDSYESWLDIETLSSLRFIQRINEGGYHPTRTFEIHPERGFFQQNDKPEEPTVAQPLDDASFFFFLRTIPLEVGRTYEFNRYFNPKANPVIIRVLRREHIRVAAGEFDAIVIQPIIKTSGLFSDNGMAELWLSDDPRRILLQLKSKFSIVNLSLGLKQMTLPPLSTDPAK